MIIDVKNLNKSFRHPWNMKMIQVLKDVSFSVEQKSIVGFLGANGAGKTTSIKCILGLLSYQSGEISIFGENHLSLKAKENIGYLPERPFFYNYLTANEFLKFYGQLNHKVLGKDLDKRIDYLLELVGLSHAKSLYLKQFSKGMLQRIGMAQALIHRPKLLILDEPLSGLDPDGRRQLAEIIKTVHEEGATVFFSSHLLDDVDRLCNELVVIKEGRVRFNGLKVDFAGQRDRGFVIQGLQQRESVSFRVSSQQELQKKIDELRSQQIEILSVESEKVSLDQAFKAFQTEPSL